MSYDGQDPSEANISELAAMFGVGRQRIRNNIEKAITAKEANIFGFQIIPLYLPLRILGFTKTPSIEMKNTTLTIWSKNFVFKYSKL